MEDCVAFRARSISLPSFGLIHPPDVIVELQLSRLRQASQSEASLSSICGSLGSVEDLYEHINGLILLPVNQQVLSHDDNHRDGVEAVLEGSLALLDICGAAIDAVSKMKESILELESSLRRRSGEVSSCLSAYKATRRRIIKSVSKCLGELKKSEHKARLEKDDRRLVSILRLLKEAQVICLSTLKSLLVFLSGPKAQHTFSLVAILIHSSDSEEKANELAKIDRALFALHAKNLSTNMKTTQSIQKQLGVLEMTIDQIEDGLGSVSRCLVRTRVSLLNVLNH